MGLFANLDIDTITYNLLPIRKRVVGTITFLLSLVSPIKWINNIFYNVYLNGSVTSYWSAITTYNKTDRVIGSNNSVYESLTNGNLNNNPNSSSNWIKIADSFVGKYQYEKYNAQISVFEYALNQWFNTTYRQPTLTADIYLQNIDSTPDCFVVGYVEDESSISYYLDVEQEAFIIDTYTFNQSDFTIFVPIAIWTALGATTTDRDNIIRKYADNFNLAGITYTITPY